MSTRILDTSTGATIDLGCILDGIDVLGDVLAGSGYEEGPDGWIMGARDVRFWTTWSAREERIHEAYQVASCETRAALESAVSEYGYDMETLQDIQESVLGISE